MTFTGLAHFRNQVLFIDPVRDVHLDGLSRIAGKHLKICFVRILFRFFFKEICREIYHKNGILSTDKRPFQPHLTLFKLSKARGLRRKGKTKNTNERMKDHFVHSGVTKIDPLWSQKYTDYHFGVESLRSLHLCNMLEKQSDGYYEIFHEQHFSSLFFFLFSIRLDFFSSFLDQNSIIDESSKKDEN